MNVPAVVDKDTGEIVQAFDLPAYLTDLTSDNHLARQQQLAAAYDAACRSLIGPNDVQREGKREFKKKSAWRKLQRHFSISTEIQAIDRAWSGDVFVATVTVRAVAPWGQHAEAVGACGTDEETGRRKITIADAIATAETRATNRAVSNLIAMGEVSAEEIGDRPSYGDKNGEPLDAIPFGKEKGKKFAECSDEHLGKLRAWCEEKAKFPDLIEGIDLELDSRREKE